MLENYRRIKNDQRKYFNEVKRMSKISEVLSVAYDSGDEDISCLVVAKKRDGEFTVLNEFHGAEADKLYHDLLNRGKEE